MNTQHSLMNRLMQRALSLNDEISRVDLQAREPLAGGDEGDQAQAIKEANDLSAMRLRATGELGRIQAAIRRIESGHFGECSRCGCEIDEKRLEANISATLCFQCQSEAEISARGRR